MYICNTTLEDARIVETPLSIGITMHHLLLLLTMCFALPSLLISIWLMLLHAWYYSKPAEQRHIVRILFVMPVYTIASFLGIVYYRHKVYFELGWNLYEAFVIASFFTLSCNYVAPTLRDQKLYFASFQPKAWPWPLSWTRPCTGGNNGIFGPPGSGIVWINILWIGVFQYCLFKVLLGLAATTLEALDKYCENSLSPAFGYIWLLVFESISVTIAKYCLMSHWHSLGSELNKQHKTAKLQLVCVMLVVYLTFWQNLIWTVLTSERVGVMGPSEHNAYGDISIGIPIAVLNLEMLIYSIMHLFAYSYKRYKFHPATRTADGAYLGFWWAILAICVPWDIIKAIGRAVRLLIRGRSAWIANPVEEDQTEVELLAKKPKPAVNADYVSVTSDRQADPREIDLEYDHLTRVRPR